MIRKTLAFVSLLALCAVLLPGCEDKSNSTPPNGNNTVEKPADGPALPGGEMDGPEQKNKNDGE